MNKLMLLGRLTKDIELKGEGDKLRGLTSIAINQSKDKVTFVDVVFWRQQAENAAKYLYKGRQVCVEGMLRIDKKDTKTYVSCQVERFYFVDSLKNKESNENDEYPY